MPTHSVFNWRPKIQLQLKRFPLVLSRTSDGDHVEVTKSPLDNSKSNALAVDHREDHPVNSSPSPPTERGDWGGRRYAPSPPVFIPAHATQIDRRSLSTPSRLSPTKFRNPDGRQKTVRFDDEGRDGSNATDPTMVVNSSPSIYRQQTDTILAIPGAPHSPPSLSSTPTTIVHNESRHAADPPRPPSPPTMSASWHHLRENEGRIADSSPPPLYQRTYPQRVPPRPPARQMSHTNRANALLNQLRSDEQSESESSAVNELISLLPPIAPSPFPMKHAQRVEGWEDSAVVNGGDTASVIFLEHQGGVKRCPLPERLLDIGDIKRFFIRSFAQLGPSIMDSSVKVYIQEASGHIFYELEDIRSPKFARAAEKFPTRNRMNAANALEWLSESEIDFDRQPPGRTSPSRSSDKRVQQIRRPASVQPVERSKIRDHVSTGNSRAAALSPYSRSIAYDSQHDCYNSSDSSSPCPMTRSSSSTPVQMDADTRQRMDAMESQLMGLSSLVHSALISKEMNPVAMREMMDLRREILELQHQPSMYTPTNVLSNENLRAESGKQEYRVGSIDKLKSILDSVKNTQSELKRLRKFTSMSSQQAAGRLNMKKSTEEEMIILDSEETKSAIEHIVVANSHSLMNGGIPPATIGTSRGRDATGDSNSEELREDHLITIAALNESLRLFEEEIEKTRASVLNTDRKLKLGEVEEMTSTLTRIGKGVAQLKGNFAGLQLEVEKEIKRHMQQIVRDETFLKQAMQEMDSCLRRCKSLASVLTTMKKLAMIQDPGISRIEGHQTKVATTTSPLHPPPNDARGVRAASSVKENKYDVLDSILDELSQEEQALQPAPPERRYKAFGGNGTADTGRRGRQSKGD